MSNEPLENFPDFATNAELARLLRKAPISLARARESGELPFHRFGASIRYSRSDVHTYLSHSRNRVLKKANHK